MLSGLAPATHVNNGLSSSQAQNGVCRSEGLKRLVTGQHVPDRLTQLAGELDLRDFRAALTAETALGALVAGSCSSLSRVAAVLTTSSLSR